MLKALIGAGLACLLASVLAPLPAHAAEALAPADYAKPVDCPAHYDLVEASGTCKPRDAEIRELPQGQCSGDGLRLTKENKCAASEAPPSPQCKAWSGRKSRISGSGSKASCLYEPTLAVSGLGDYIGDCFEITGALPTVGLKPKGIYLVTGQGEAEGNDRELTLVDARSDWYYLGCEAVPGSKHKAMASGLMESGALRSGYAYGFLTMPYKYYPGAKSFVTGIPIGGYLGWRNGKAGSGRTLAAAVTLSSVKANTVDPTKLGADGKPTATGSADVAALSLAFGWMFDVSKTAFGKPFKAGIFAGWDFVNREPTIDYRFNRKPWIAIQIGYDFTDD
jgi:hypothetical protein